MHSPSSPDDAAFIAHNAEVKAAALEASGQWTAADDVQLAQLFERAAVKALAAPAIAERSLLVGKVARKFVPRRLRPMMRRFAGIVDKALGWMQRLVRRSQ